MSDDDVPDRPDPAPQGGPPPGGIRSVFAGLLMGCGILIAGLSGLCLIVLAGEQMGHPDPLARSINSSLMIVSGIILAAGVGIIFLGRYILNRDKRDGE